MPFYPSPFRDGGYDISDFFNVHPDYGSIGDLVALLEDAHRRGIRVVADLVMNHTSDEHPWFVESRSSRDNAKADWYVWNDDDQKLAGCPSRLHRRGALELDVGRHAASSTTGTASTITSPTSTTRTPKWPTP